MPTPHTEARLEYLSEYSTIDAPWDSSRKTSDTVASYYKDTDYHKLGERIDRCANRLGYANQVDENGSLRLRLRSVFLCHVRHCMVCQRSRTRVWYKRFDKGIPAMVADHPTVKFIFLTLTVKNCAIATLRPTLEQMSQAFTKLMKRRGVAKVVTGYARSMEVTKAEDGTAHPHFHVLMAVKSTYFNGNHYITQDAWATMWQESLGVDYKPVTDVRAVKPKREIQSHQSIMEAVKETAKYTVKAGDLVGKGTPDDKLWLLELTKQLHGIKQMNLSGLFREYIKQGEPVEEEILLANNDDDEELETDKDLIFFNWFKSLKRYARFAD